MIWAIVRTRFHGIHRWPDAPEGPQRHLSYPHRHVFHVTVWVEQSEKDRDVEYLELKAWLKGELPGPDLDTRSCEDIASELQFKVRERYNGSRYVKVEVSEDGENGAMVE